MKNILVTGADGFIGSHLAEALVRQNYSVRAMVQYNSFNNWGWLEQVEPSVKDAMDIVLGDVRDPHAMRQAVLGCDAVLHLAALIAIPYSYTAPESYVSTNVLGTLNLLEAARIAEVGQFIQTSTSEVYGSAQFVPITEDHPLQPQSPYSASKIGADSLALAYHYSYGLPVSLIRPFNTFGPRQSARAVIPTIITQIINGINRIKLGAITPTRDFNYVQDTVNGFVAALKSPASIGNVINLSSGYEVSIKDIAFMIADVMGAEIEIASDQINRLRPENSEVNRLLGDGSRARELLGWEPQFAGLSGLKRGLSETATWFSKSSNLALYKSSSYVV